MSISRRKLLISAAATAVTPTVRGLELPHIWVPGQTFKPIVVSSSNGHNLKNDIGETCVQTAFRMISSGSDVLDSVIAGVNIVELDQRDSSVGYGGLPNADGVVQLDSCCMHGPNRWAGGVAALEGIRTPSKIAQLVASSTDHHLLVGKGAQTFAKAMGFAIEEDLNSEGSRKTWLEWKRRTDPSHYLDPTKRDRIGLEAALAMSREGWIDPEHVWGTISCNGLNSKGDVCGVTTTSGLAFKIPGRVGDSPILGAGLYVDNEVGAAGSTGRGEANLYGLCSFLIVDEMRRGAHPKDAGLEALRRVTANTKEKRLLNENGKPNFGLNFYVFDKKGRYAGVTLSGGGKYAVCDDKGPRQEDLVALN